MRRTLFGGYLFKYCSVKSDSKCMIFMGEGRGGGWGGGSSEGCLKRGGGGWGH